MKNKLNRALSVIMSLVFVFNIAISSSAASKSELQDQIADIQAEREQKFAENLNRKLSLRRNFILHGVPFDYDYGKVVRGISAKDIQKLAKKVNNGNRLVAIYREQ